MKVTPRTEEEIKFLKLIPDGEYEFEVFDAIDETSKNGNEMIHVVLLVNKNEKKYYIHDYLMDTADMAFKLRHFCDSIGIIEDFNSGNIESNKIKSKKGIAKIIINQDKKGIYNPKNVIRDYIVNKSIKSEDIFNDELPF